MPWRSTRFDADRVVIVVVTTLLLLFASPVRGDTGPFDHLGGAWSGTGTVKLTKGGNERIKCKAAYDPRGAVATLRLTCASDTYKITLIGTMEQRDGAITGKWTETTRDVEGSFTGRLDGDKIVLRTSGVITATLTLATTGSRQTVVLQLQGSTVQSVSLTMAREAPAADTKDVISGR
jgi:hypothetical protein